MLVSIIIFGLTDLAEVLIYHLQNDERYRIKAITADNKYLQEVKRGGVLRDRYPTIPVEEIYETLSPEDYVFFVCIGYSNMNEGRKQVFERIRRKGYKIASYTHPTALVQTRQIGEGNLFFENVTIGPLCTVGDGNIFYPCSHVAHHTDVGDFNFMAISCSVAGHVKIGNQCFFGNNCTTNNGISVADKTLVGAGAYLAKDSSEGDVIVPVRSLKLDNSISSDLI